MGFCILACGGYSYLGVFWNTLMTVTAEGTNEAAEATFEKRVSQFITVREAIQKLETELEEKIKPLRDIKELLSGWLITHLQKIGVESARTSFGTCSLSKKYSASLADPDGFMKWVIANNQFELIDRRANVTAVRAYLEETKSLPPGVNFSSYISVGVQRPRKKSEHLTTDET